MKKKYRGFPSSPLQAITHLISVFKLNSTSVIMCHSFYLDVGNDDMDL